MPKVSIVIPVYKPEKEVLDRIRNMIKKQTVKAELVENWNMPQSKSFNTGIKKSKGDIIVTLSQDCVPEDEFWLEKLIKPLENKEVVATVSDLHITKDYWERRSFLIRILTINDRKIRKPTMDAKACAYRKKDLEKIGLFNEDPKIIGIDADLYLKLKKIGKIVRANVKVFHLHKFDNFKKTIKTICNYSKSNGNFVKEYGLNNTGFCHRIARATPYLGFASMFYRFPLKEYSYFIPLYLCIAPLEHVINVIFFWNGFFFNKESERNIEVLNENHKK